MIRLLPRSTRTYTLLPYTTRFRSAGAHTSRWCRRLPGGDRKAFQPENAKRCPYEDTAPRPDPMYRHSGYGESLRYRIRSTTSYADRHGHLHWYLSKRPDQVLG